ncbi:peroxisomal membrane protein PEX14 [Culicoides brevitarsis]|uniref:peroxisomal membrane protein PEX14 n=1 Tax=Culicoides brevitarsis TaxID=469753 RepID=UPI00307BEC90
MDRISTNNDDPEALNLREDLIITAVNFLTNPNVKRCTLSQKQKFLRNKGLTDKEIEVASVRAGIFLPNNNNNSNNNNETQQSSSHTIINMDRHSLIVQPPNAVSTFTKIKSLFGSLALVSSLMYGVYYVIQNFIKPFLFGSRKPKTVEQKLDEFTTRVENDLKMLFKEINDIKADIAKSNQTEMVKREIQAFQQDLDKIRGLLLNKKQFASPSLPSMMPSIPQWQLDAAAAQDPEEEKNEDAGSGSSETKNSDSSLEIM